MRRLNRKIRVMLVDDHFIVRLGLAASLQEESDLEVVAEAGDGREAVELFRLHKPDVVVLDQRLPGLDGPEVMAAIRSEQHGARFVALSINDDEESIHRAVAAGAQAFLPKSVDRVELVEAVRSVHAGETYFPAAIMQRLSARNRRPELTSREQRVLELLVGGQSNKEIASTLGVAEITVKQHVSAILNKLGVADRTQAAMRALALGLVRRP